MPFRLSEEELKHGDKTTRDALVMVGIMVAFFLAIFYLGRWLCG